MKKNNATSGLTWFVLVGFVALVAFVCTYPFETPKQTSKRYTCLSHLKQMSMASLMYANENNDTLPNAAAWMDTTTSYTSALPDQGECFHDVTYFKSGNYGYSFREEASAQKIVNIPNPVAYILIFDSTLLQRNAHSTTKSLPQPGRHGGRNNVAYLDGHAKVLKNPVETK